MREAGLRAPLGAGAGLGARQGDLPALADGRPRPLDYPPPIVDHDDAAAEIRARRES